MILVRRPSAWQPIIFRPICQFSIMIGSLNQPNQQTVRSQSGASKNTRSVAFFPMISSSFLSFICLFIPDNQQWWSRYKRDMENSLLNCIKICKIQITKLHKNRYKSVIVVYIYKSVFHKNMKTTSRQRQGFIYILAHEL